jgi:rhamnogalacturonyl hydrolase YesR
MLPNNKPVVREKGSETPNDPMMPIAWISSYHGRNGQKGRVFTTTMGASEDLESEGLRRLLVNAAYWCLGMEKEIPERSNVDLVGLYRPTPFGFGKYTKGLKPADHLATGADRTLSVTKVGKTLKINARVPEDLTEVIIQLISSRNRPLAHFWEVAPNDPNQKPRDPAIPRETGRWYRGPLVQGTADTRDVWFPTVDVELEPGMGAVLVFPKGTKGRGLYNGPYHNLKSQFRDELRIEARHLEPWENTVVVEPATAVPKEFVLEQRVPAILGKVHRTFTLLSEDWNGTVNVCFLTGDGSSGQQISSADVEGNHSASIQHLPGKDLERERLLQALKATIDFTLSSQIKSRQSPMEGGFFLFYDLDAKTFRNSYWQWGWGPSIRNLLQVLNIPELGFDPDEILSAAEAAVQASLRYRVSKESDPLENTPITRWSRSMAGENFYFPAITIGDLLFLVGWAWVPLYEATGEEKYLEESISACDLTGKLMNQFPIIPHTYAPAAGEWYDFALCETGFGVEGFAETFRVTGEDRIRDLGAQFIRQHLDTFQREDGLWERLLVLETREIRPAEYHTRGVGWAMEGLLASHRMDPKGPYLELAERMAAQVLNGQRSEGYWTFYFNRPKEAVGTTQKGTAIWSYLLYRLYSHTGKEKYLSAARKALRWCLDQQYFGEDREAWGSIPDANPQSGVGYRKWFRLSCLYTSGFFGMAIVEELKLNR